MSDKQQNWGMDNDMDFGDFPNLSGAATTSEDPSQPEQANSEQNDFSESQIAELKTKAAKADENWDKYVRISADFDNYKKRAAREKIESVKYANEALLERLIPILDNFEAAMTAANSAQGSNIDSLKTGVSMILSQFKNFLSDSGLEEIEAAGKAFDPNLHEAVSQQPSADLPEGQVLQQ